MNKEKERRRRAHDLAQLRAIKPFTVEHRLYRGELSRKGGTEDWSQPDQIVKVLHLSGGWGELEHDVRHSPDGFGWGYGGAGPSELARCILRDALSLDRPHPAFYHAFRDAFVRHWPKQAGWEVTAETIRQWAIGWLSENDQAIEEEPWEA